MISGHGTIETAVRAIQQGAYDFIEKPFKSDRLLLVVRRALEAARLRARERRASAARRAETELTGDSPGHHQLARRRSSGWRRPASRVLISGPAGSGKEVAARMIHARSRRADGPFVVLNCATLNPARFEEELFGIEAGADPVAAAAPGRACWNAPMAARCCSTRSPTCRSRPRARSSAPCRIRHSSASAARRG